VVADGPRATQPTARKTHSCHDDTASVAGMLWPPGLVPVECTPSAARALPEAGLLGLSKICGSEQLPQQHCVTVWAMASCAWARNCSAMSTAHT
jgi:hypothetical protein